MYLQTVKIFNKFRKKYLDVCACLPHAVLPVLPVVVLHEAEAAGRPLELVEPHDDSLDLAAHPEQLVDLLLRRVERHVAHIQCCGLPQQPLLLSSGTLELNFT